MSNCLVRMSPASVGRQAASLSLFLVAMLISASLAADFPPPDQLPANPNLPDPLVMFDGRKVTTKEQWQTQRKPELKALFQHYMYGRLPPTPKRQTYNVLFKDDRALG